MCRQNHLTSERVDKQDPGPGSGNGAGEGIRRENSMSDKEKALVEQIGKLPDDIQDRFLDMANGALMALDAQPKQEDADDAERES